MFIKYFKLIIIISLLYPNPIYSKNKSLNKFNSQDLSNYFSGIVAYENKDNLKALEFFKSSKFLLSTHESFSKKYVNSLVLESKVVKAIKIIDLDLQNNSSGFFEAYLLKSLESLKKKDFEKSRNYIELSSKFINNSRFERIIYETIKEYLYLFEKNEIPKNKKNFGNLSIVNEIFQRCYLDDKKTETYFTSLINNSDENEYSRYIFFKINYLIKNEELDKVEKISNNINYLNSSLLISQAKKWIEDKRYNEFNKIFSCKRHNDLISEFLFLISNFYSSQNNYEKSNFYLNLSYYLNPKFKFNLSLLIDNHYLSQNYTKAKKFLNIFDNKDDFYYWFKLKKNAQIISKQISNEASLDFINKKFKNIKNPSIKIIFDMANFNKNSKKYAKAVNYYDKIILKIDPNSIIYSDILYRRGSSHERLENYLKADKDFLKSLEINPDDAYVLNYLAYSWLERKYKIDSAIVMLEKAYALKKNDPYIIDSIGWAYYMTNNFLKAESLLKKAVELMPNDPIVNDHYGDILWKLDRKLQARYFWKNVLDLEETKEEMKKNINIKLIKGLSTF